MANIKCKSCGRRYSYHESDLCPNCGAYNRPSSRLRVDFDKDGNAELLTEEAFLDQSKTGKQREKVCYERKECHEQAVRRGGGIISASWWTTARRRSGRCWLCRALLAVPGVHGIAGKPEKWVQLPDGLTPEMFQAKAGAIDAALGNPLK